MAAFITTDFTKLFSISIKQRTDNYTDQYNRIFMVKVFLACTIVMGVSWYTDSVNCIIPDSQSSGKAFPKFVSQSCWINGMYVYKVLRNYTDMVSYYGIPKDPDSDGLMKDQLNISHLCRTKNKRGIFGTIDCRPMEKTFYLQYQWMPFFICALALLYYVPYMAQKTINHDIINLSNEIEKEDLNVDEVVKHYFKNRNNKRKSNMPTVRQIINLLIKIGYLVVNVIAFVGLNSVLLGEFKSYGVRWVSWSNYNNSVAHDYMGARDFPKPGNELLPPFGFCDVWSSSKDVKQSFVDKHKFVCEMSQHVLYQYTFLLLWFVIIIGIVVSVIGILILLFHYTIGIAFRKRNDNNLFKKISQYLTYREMEYLEYLSHKNIPVYGEVLSKLKERCIPDYDANDGDMPLLNRRRPSLEKANGSPYRL